MTSLSSRFSSLSTANGKAYHPPKPTYNSPKLVQDAHQVLSPSQDNAKLNHPFATSSYGARRRAPTEPVPYREPASISPRNIPHTSEFGSFHSDREHAPLAQDRVDVTHTASFTSSDFDLDAMGRKRSSTLGSQHVVPSDFAALDDFLPSPNPFKSQFDDSEDEEKLDNTSKTLSGVPHRARLAALGTASRLFKGRRHSRNSSGAMTPYSSFQHLPPPLQVDKRTSKYRDATPPSRPTTSDGTIPSPNPRQAVFGHRPSPSELSVLSSRSEKARSVAPADRDLILGLTGSAFKPSRPKTADRKKLLSRQSDQHRQSSGVPASFEDAKAQWMAPPPYCADESDLSRRDRLRKSQSLSTLRFDPSRRPRQPSPVSQVNEHRSSVHISNKCHADQTAWEAMLTESPNTLSDHSSISSCGRVTKTEVISDSPPRRLPKAQRLPPQKPPPQFGLPPPPPLASRFSSEQHFSDSTKASLEVGVPCASLAVSNTSVQNVVQASDSAPSSAAATITTAEGSLVQLCTKPASPKGRRLQLSTPSPVYSKQAQPHSQVVLDVGGTKFVTLLSTLRGKAGDQPRLIDTLERNHKSDSESALCNDICLTRSQRVDVSQCAIHERSGSDQSSQGSHFTTVDETSPAEQMTSQPHTGLGLGLGMALEPSISQSSASLSTTASGTLSHTESDTSTRRTSDVSDTSNWSKADGEAVHAMASDAPQHAHPNTNVAWDHAALPSSRLCSPHFPSEPSPTTLHHPHSVSTSIFLDRNGDLYRDILDILRTSKLPYRLQAASIVSSSSNAKCSDNNGDACSLSAMKLQLRCRLHEVMEESDWLGYPSIVRLCEAELCLV